MPIALVTSTVKAAAAGLPRTVTTDAIDTTGATFLVVCVANYNVGAPSATVTDSKTNTWSALTAQGIDPPNNRCQLFYAANPTVGTNHTFTAATAGADSYLAAAVASFSGVATTTPFDLESGAENGAAVTSIQPGSVTPSEANEVLIAGLSFENNNTVAIGSAFTISNQLPWASGQNFGVAMAYKIQTTASAENPTWSWTTADEISTVLAAFKAAAAAGGRYNYLPLLGVR